GDGLAQRMVTPEVLDEDFVDEVIGIVLIHLDLFQNYAEFTADILGIENRIQHQVAQNVERDRQVLIENFDVEANAFFGGKGIHVAANGDHLACNILGGPAAGTLKHHVLEEMRDAVGLGVFVAGTGFDPNADGNRADVLHLLGKHRETVRQNLPANVPEFLNHGWKPLRLSLEFDTL